MIVAKRTLAVLAFVVACGAPPKATEPIGYTPATQETTAATVTPSDPLPSWNDGPVKAAMVEFVRRVTTIGADAVPPEDRVAVFDNDGTLWQEKPIAEGAFAFARLEEMSLEDSSLRQREPYKSALERDVTSLHRQGAGAIIQLMVLTHTGMTDDAFIGAARDFLATARHPRFQVPYTSLVYQPMIELLELLRNRGFSIYLCSGGDTDFMRVFARALYGIPPEHVIGSRFEKELLFDGTTSLTRRPHIEALNDKEGKPKSLDRQLGKRPVFAVGNVGSGGDIAMLRWTRDRIGPSFAMLIEHDDAVREAAYEERDGASLHAARAYGFKVVSMKRDWHTIFPGH